MGGAVAVCAEKDAFAGLRDRLGACHACHLPDLRRGVKVVEIKVIDGAAIAAMSALCLAERVKKLGARDGIRA